jgi:ketopantoate reductase
MNPLSAITHATCDRKLGAFRTSMPQDVLAGRQLEIGALLTAVSEIAARVSIPVPDLDALPGVTRIFARTRGLYPDRFSFSMALVIDQRGRSS